MWNLTYCTFVRQVVDIMRVNVDKVLERDQKLSELDDRADALQAGASQFESSAAKLKNKYWWKNCKVGMFPIMHQSYITTTASINQCDCITSVLAKVQLAFLTSLSCQDESAKSFLFRGQAEWVQVQVLREAGAGAEEGRCRCSYQSGILSFISLPCSFSLVMPALKKQKPDFTKISFCSEILACNHEEWTVHCRTACFGGNLLLYTCNFEEEVHLYTYLIKHFLSILSVMDQNVAAVIIMTASVSQLCLQYLLTDFKNVRADKYQFKCLNTNQGNNVMWLRTALCRKQEIFVV